MKPTLDLLWVKGTGSINLKRPNVFFGLGARGSGKSAFLELIASKYLDNGGKVIDLFGSRDGEGLAWLRSPYAKEKRIILLRGSLVEVKSEHANIDAAKFSFSDLEKGDIFISASPLYESIDAEFNAVNRVIDVLYKRHHWRDPIFLIMREASNLIYSRIKITKSQSMAKGETIYLMRESRHAGLALGLDSIRHTAIDVDLRSLTDYLIIKNTGMHGLPDDLHWVYRTFDPVQLRRFKPNEFILIDRHGHLGLGTFTLPSWHKREAEDILDVTGVQLRYYTQAGEGDQNRELIVEALEALPLMPEPNEVATWIKENKGGVVMDPITVGKQVRRLGYRVELAFKDGKQRRRIIKNP